jgi:hypothetical protein
VVCIANGFAVAAAAEVQGLAGHTAPATDEIAGKALTDMTRLASHAEILTTELRGFAARIRAM